MQEIVCLRRPSMVALVIISEGVVHARSEAGEVQVESEG